MIVAFMNALDEENRNGSTIPITMSNPTSARLHHGGSRFCDRFAPLPQLRAQLAHPASLVSSPSRPRGRRTKIAIR